MGLARRVVAALPFQDGFDLCSAGAAGLAGIPNNLAYVTSKHAVVGLTKALAVDWARHGVRVNCVAPGPTLTPAVLASHARGERNPETMQRATALGRLVQPDEIAAPVEFLLSPGAGAITGVILPVDAGVMATGLWQMYGGPPE